MSTLSRFIWWIIRISTFCFTYILPWCITYFTAITNTFLGSHIKIRFTCIFCTWLAIFIIIWCFIFSTLLNTLMWCIIICIILFIIWTIIYNNIFVIIINIIIFYIISYGANIIIYINNINKCFSITLLMFII